MKNSSDTIGDRPRDLPDCSAVPQPTAPPRCASVSVEATLKKEIGSEGFCLINTFLFLFADHLTHFFAFTLWLFRLIACIGASLSPIMPCILYANSLKLQIFFDVKGNSNRLHWKYGVRN